MAYKIRRLEYFYAQVSDQPGAAYELLSSLAGLGVNLLALTAVPIGPEDTQLTLFPEDPHRLLDAAKKAGLPLTGPHPAILVQGDDELGAGVLLLDRGPVAAQATGRCRSDARRRAAAPRRTAGGSRACAGARRAAA